LLHSRTHPPQEGRHRVFRHGTNRGPDACSLWAT
jgi:hypothetical protein